MICFDHHSHHARCGHATGSIEDYIQAAIARGISEIGITDHAPILWMEGDHPLPGSAMARSELGCYVDEVLSLRERYADRIRVLLGLEADYAPGFEAAYRDMLAEYPFDYVIGSVHYSHDWHIYDRRRWEAQPSSEAVYAEYFRLVRASASCGLFDVLGHITGIMAYGPQPERDFLASEFEATAAEIAAEGVAIEINTSGIRKGGHEPFPNGALLRRCLAAGVPVTYGSDAHRPDEIGYAREHVASLLDGAVLWRPGGVS